MTVLVGLLLALASAPVALAADTVTVQIVDEEGTPIAGVALELWVGIGDDRHPQVGTTDADGRASFPLDLPSGERTYQLLADARFVDSFEGCERTRVVSATAKFVGDLPPDPWVITATTWTTYKCPAPPDGSPVIHVTYSLPDGSIPEIAGAGITEIRGDGLTYSSRLTPDGDGLSASVYDWPDATLGISVSMPSVSQPPDEDGCIHATTTLGQLTVSLGEALAGPIHVTLDEVLESSVCGETSAPNAPNGPDITLPPTDTMPADRSPAGRASPVWILIAVVGLGILIARRPFARRDGRDASS
jgi:hypothetical protein